MIEPLLLLLFIGLAGVFLVVGVFFARLLQGRRQLEQRLAAQGVDAEAEVIAHRTAKITRRAATLYYLTYRYRVSLAGGEPQEFVRETAVSKQDYDDRDVGSHIPIRYAPDAPGAALPGPGVKETYSTTVLWLNTLGCLALGLAFMVGGIGYAISQAKNNVLPGSVSDGPLLVSVLVSSKLQIMRLRTDGTQRMMFANGGVDQQDPLWSPDGRQIALVSGNWTSADQRIIVMDANGQNQKVLTAQPGRTYESLAWSADGKQILVDAYSSSRYEIWVMSADGSNQRSLSSSEAYDDRLPARSPDGRQIVFRRSSRNSSSSVDWAIWRMNADGSQAVPLTDGANEDSEPVWAPNGQHIAFIRGKQNAGVWIMNSDGSNAMELAPGPDFQHDLAWSPNSQSLAVIGISAGVDAVIVMNADGSNVHLADPTLGYADLDFTWSPDGKQMVVVANGLSNKEGELLIVDLAHQTDVAIVSDLYCSGVPAWMPPQ